MATTYKATRAAAGQSAKTRTGIVHDYSEFTISAAFVINDVVQLFKIPTNARVLAFTLDLPILDTNVSPAAAIDVGDSANGANYYVSNLNAGTHFSVACFVTMTANGVAGTLGTRYAADDTLSLKIHTAPATGATSGTIHAHIVYEMDGGSQTGF